MGPQPLVERVAAGRTDLVFELVEGGAPASTTDVDGVPLLRWCAYYGDVSAIRFLLARGETLATLGDDLDLNGAAFHGHWRLCEFLLEHRADANRPLPSTGETPLHAAVSRANRPASGLVVDVLLRHGADPNRATLPGVETDCFMRDARTRGETPLHRAAAFAPEDVVRRLLEAGARRDVRDAAGESPLGWASWHQRPDAVLRLLCFDDFAIHPARDSPSDHGHGWSAMDRFLLGSPHPPA
jgi:ankyrin repeat protein